MVQQHGNVNSVLRVDVREGSLYIADNDLYNKMKNSPFAKDLPFIIDKMI